MSELNHEHEVFLEKEFLDAFNSTKPPLAGLPHRIVRSDEAALRCALDVAHAKAGLWGCVPLTDATGEPFVSRETHLVDEFSLWELPVNQEYCVQRGGRGKIDDTSFVMVIDSRTPAHVLHMTYALFRDGDGCYRYDRYISAVAEWISDLRWVFIPLAGETDLAIFVVASEHEAWLRSFDRCVEGKGGTSLELTRKKDRFFWPTEMWKRA